MRVLIVGGYGAFGGRLAELLADAAGMHLIIAGRSLSKAQAFCEDKLARAACQPAVFDRDGDVRGQLRALSPHVVVDASGPFQAYGEDAHSLIKAAISLGISYLDLADSSDFVEGVEAFDDFARANKVFVLSGLSTCPVLTTAAVRRCRTGSTRSRR